MPVSLGDDHEGTAATAFLLQPAHAQVELPEWGPAFAGTTREAMQDPETTAIGARVPHPSYRSRACAAPVDKKEAATRAAFMKFWQALQTDHADGCSVVAIGRVLSRETFARTCFLPASGASFSGPRPASPSPRLAWVNKIIIRRFPQPES